MTLKEKISKRSKNGRDFTGILVECFDCKKELYRQPAFVKRSNNRIENLQLFESNSAHLKHHMSLKRAGL